ncbi:MAG: ABC transporter ATP-binding protein [Chloroflexi bacterium]|nr:MAG: ABC transporter ATP-binding protein [Chloroflexota bacterium]
MAQAGATRSGTAVCGRPPGRRQTSCAMTLPIGVEAVSFRYPDGTQALEDVDLLVERGERLAIIGQNGSGKSTLVRQFNGLLRPTSGRVLIDDVDAAAQHVAHLAAKVGLVFQNPDRQIFAAKVRSEVAFGPRNLGMTATELERAVYAALESVGLTDQADTNPYDLGYSRRKLLALASILAMRTPIVVLDEPTTGQDARGVARIQQIVAELAEAGRTIITISHDMRFVAESFERVIVMRAGQIILDGTPAEVFAEAAWPALATTYLEPPLPARVGANAGVGATPTEAVLVASLAALGNASAIDAPNVDTPNADGRNG